MEPRDLPVASHGPFHAAKLWPTRANGLQPGSRSHDSYTMQLVCQSGNHSPDSDIVDRNESIDRVDWCGGTVDNYLKPKLEGRVGNTAKWVLSGTMITTTIVMSACQRSVQDPRMAFQQSAMVTITANCTAGKQADVKVEPWVLGMKKNSEVTFVARTTSGAVIDVTEKTAEPWPFVEKPPFKGNSRGKTKDKKGIYKYNVQVACYTGTSDEFRVVIDPDIIVD